MRGKHPSARIILTALVLCVSLLPGCGGADNHDIVILYTNDVHCGIDEAIGYAGLAAYKETILLRTPYVTLVDCGDAVQGGLIGTVSKGEYIVDIMNETGYDLAVLGNHEFDYGLPRLKTLMERSDAAYIGCNIVYTGDGENMLAAVKPYEIKTYGKTKVAFIGVSTPRSITSSTPAYFMDEAGNLVYNFSNESGGAFYARVQGYVDECVRNGADYVIVCAHLGEDEGFSPFSSVDLIANTSGIDAVLDAHAHSVIPSRIVRGKDGADVPLSSTGTRLQNIGQLIITAGGTVATGLISGYGGRDTETQAFVEGIRATYEGAMNEVVAVSDTALSVQDGNGIRLVRNRETAIGNFCADAYRAISGADIAFVNGGGIRADLPAGDITYADVMAVHPFGNALCMVTATGQEILDALEHSARYTRTGTEENGSATGESGGFLQVSGLRFTIDTSVESAVETDENGLFASVGNARRITDARVLGAVGSYEPIDPAKMYTVASHNYMLKDGGDGYTMFADNEFLIDGGMADYQMLITYLTDTLGGQLGAYAQTDGRISVR